MKETLSALRQTLMPIYGKGETEAIIRLIFHYVKGWNLTDILIHQQDELSDFIKGQIESILQRLKKYEPIQYVTGEARFHGMDMMIKPGVLIPRPETEELVDIIVEGNKDWRDLKVLDLCTGSGCIAIALARNLPFSDVSALDISKDALLVASRNIKDLRTNVKLIDADIFTWEPIGKYDIIVSNPPYVLDREIFQMERNVLDYEPHEALFVRDDNPLIFYNRIADLAKGHLNTEGRLYLEINPLTHKELKDLLKGKGFTEIEILKDSYGKNRFIIASI